MRQCDTGSARTLVFSHRQASWAGRAIQLLADHVTAAGANHTWPVRVQDDIWLIERQLCPMHKTVLRIYARLPWQAYGVPLTPREFHTIRLISAAHDPSNTPTQVPHHVARPDRTHHRRRAKRLSPSRRKPRCSRGKRDPAPDLQVTRGRGMGVAVGVGGGDPGSFEASRAGSVARLTLFPRM